MHLGACQTPTKFFTEKFILLIAMITAASENCIHSQQYGIKAETSVRMRLLINIRLGVVPLSDNSNDSHESRWKVA